MSSESDETRERPPQGGYESPALARLRQRERRWPPTPNLSALRARPPTTEMRLAALEEQLADLREQQRTLTERIALLEQQQLALVANLHDAHRAFRQLASRVDELNARVQALLEQRAPDAAQHG